MDAMDEHDFCGEWDRLIRAADHVGAEAAVRAAESSGAPASAALGWYVLAGHLDGVAARSAYRHAITAGSPEIKAWAGVRLGRLLEEAGERDAARTVLLEAARQGHPHATPAALEALDAMAHW